MVAFAPVQLLPDPVHEVALVTPLKMMFRLAFLATVRLPLATTPLIWKLKFGAGGRYGAVQTGLFVPPPLPRHVHEYGPGATPGVTAVGVPEKQRPIAGGLVVGKA